MSSESRKRSYVLRRRAEAMEETFRMWRVYDEFARRFNVPVRYVIYSHYHWDHASGGAVYADTARFIGHESMLPALAMPPADTPVSE